MIFKEMQDKNPDRDPIFTAIDILKDPKEIKQFCNEYEEWMIDHGDESIKGREREVTRSNIGYVLGYYDGETMKLWYSVLPDVSHPIFGSGFGRGKEITSEEAFEMGRKLGAR